MESKKDYPTHGLACDQTSDVDGRCTTMRIARWADGTTTLEITTAFLPGTVPENLPEELKQPAVTRLSFTPENFGQLAAIVAEAHDNMDEYVFSEDATNQIKAGRTT